MVAPIPGRLTEIALVATGKTTKYANPVDTKTYIRVMQFFNNDVADKYVDVWNVPDNAAAVGTAADANRMMRLTVPTLETVFLEFGAPGIVLEDENDSIQTEPETADKITFQMFGFTEAV